jgi:tRNA dimethylallyltransferase
LREWQRKQSAPLLEGMRLARFVLDPPRPVLREMIAERFEHMLERGAVDEALALSDLDPALPSAKLLGLRPLIAYGQGKLSREAAIAEAVTATRQFAKRQITWFRSRMADYDWFDPLKSNIIAQYNDFIA